MIHDSPYVRQAQSGSFASFSYEPPTTLALLAVDSIRIGDSVEPCSGGVLLKISQAEYRLREGDRIEAAGWLGAIGGPLNPGAFDYRRDCRKTASRPG